VQKKNRAKKAKGDRFCPDKKFLFPKKEGRHIDRQRDEYGQNYPMRKRVRADFQPKHDQRPPVFLPVNYGVKIGKSYVLRQNFYGNFSMVIFQW
jgi:hypothetical protein